MKYRPFPVGHPQIYTREVLICGCPQEQQRCPPLPWIGADQNPFRGFLLCRVCPPLPAVLGARKPLLPMRTRKERLVFTLCRTCAERERSSPPCRHPAGQRSWVAAYTHFELNKALEIGYTVTDLFEVCSCPPSFIFWAYDMIGLALRPMVSAWPGSRQSGWPFSRLCGLLAAPQG